MTDKRALQRRQRIQHMIGVARRKAASLQEILEALHAEQFDDTLQRRQRIRHMGVARRKAASLQEIMEALHVEQFDDTPSPPVNGCPTCNGPCTHPPFTP